MGKHKISRKEIIQTLEEAQNDPELWVHNYHSSSYTYGFVKGVRLAILLLKDGEE